MRRILIRLLPALLVLAALTSCGDDDQPRTASPVGQGNSAEAPGAPSGGGGGGGGAPGAPLKIPHIGLYGLYIDAPRRMIEEDLRRQCGGELCVTVRVEQRVPGHEICEYQGTDPPIGSEIARGSTVVILTGQDSPCTLEPDTESPEVTTTPTPTPEITPS